MKRMLKPKIEKSSKEVSERWYGMVLMVWGSCLPLPLENFQSSFEEKTPVAVIVSLHITPLYGLWGNPETLPFHKQISHCLQTF